MKKIEFYKHNLDNTDFERVKSVLNSVFLTNANITREFENKFSLYMNTKNTIAVSSCTAALHLSLLAFGIGKGDEVITTPMTFVATPNAILHAGAKPVFVDIEDESGNINAELIENAVTKRTKAIMPVHLYGNMCDMKKIREIADKYNLKIIEDAAHCIEGIRDGIRVGELSDCACFSFYATKNITCGEGGAIITNNNTVASLLYKLRLHGIDKDASMRYVDKYQHWDMDILGWKYNISDIQSALLINQLKRVENLLIIRERIAAYYEKELKKIGIRYVSVPDNTKSARHLFVIRVKKRDEIIHKLQEKGIGCSVNYRSVHNLEYYKKTFGYKENFFPVSNGFGNEVISLPLYPKLNSEELKYIINELKDIAIGL